VEVETEVQSTLKVVKNLLHRTKMRLPRVMHISTDLLDNISNTWAGETEILEGTINAAEM
jgi:hypothetical protein